MEAVCAFCPIDYRSWQEWRTLSRIVSQRLRVLGKLEGFCLCIAKACEGVSWVGTFGVYFKWNQGLPLPTSPSLKSVKMDYLPEFSGDLNLEDGLPQILTLGILALTAIYAFTRLFTDPEAGVVYQIPEPEQLREGWKGELLEEPSLKVYTFPYFKTLSAHSMPDSRLLRHPMLLPSHGTTARTCEPSYA